MIIDYSAWRAWQTCPAFWYEKYITKRQPRWPSKLRDDALCMGCLVHGGLENWQKNRQIEIPQGVIDEVTPTPDCLQGALELVWGYTQRYSEEHWPLILTEAPVLFGLRNPTCNGCGPVQECLYDCGGSKMDRDTEILGLAKVDAYFYVPEPTEIESGQEGLTLTLSEGWWVHEYKTKSPDIPMGLFMKRWATNMQASFQILALQEKLGGKPVQGVLVNVLEKPRRYLPKRTCKGCQGKWEFASWLPSGLGGWACPVCGNIQKLQALKEDPVQTPPAYYRMVVTRTEAQLAKARADMIVVGDRMAAMATQGMGSEPWAFENCIAWKKPCQYYDNHLYQIPTTEDPQMIPIPEYRGLPEEGGDQ